MNKNNAHQELHDWWHDQAEREIAPMLAKMDEYGGLGRATDLTQIGLALVDSGVQGNPANESEMQELGIYFYLVGKMARWTAAISEGRAVSDDTLYDIGIYIRMVQRLRQVGGWPV